MANDFKNSNFSFKNNSPKKVDLGKKVSAPSTSSQTDEIERIPTVPQIDEGERIPTVPQIDESERIPTVPQLDESERIPTVPQMDEGERIPTVPQMDEGERIPTVPQMDEGERIPTVPQMNEGERVPTVPQENASVPQQAIEQRMRAGKKLLLQGRMEFTSEQGEKFTIDGGNVVSADSGESEIYRCISASYQEPLVARILKSVTPRDTIIKRKSREKVLEFLTKISKEKNSHVLPLFGYGTLDIDGKDYYVEIYPFCESGDLGRQQGKISYDVLRKKVIPAVNEALHKFHEAGFVHRDVKPDNLYWYHDEVVIGDFGITCSLRGDEFTIDRTKTGTLGYYAPELMLNEIVPASDYYSFGQTLWTLYKGHMMYSELLHRYSRMGAEEQRIRINHAMVHNTYFELDEIRSEDKFFEVLIRGLLQYDIVQRFGYEKVGRWLAGDRALVHEIGNYKDSKTFDRVFSVCGKDCWDAEEIAQHISKPEIWNQAKEILYSGNLSSMLGTQSAEYETKVAVDKIVKECAVGKDDKTTTFLNNKGLAMTILHLNRYQWFAWRGMVFHDIRELGSAVSVMMEKDEAAKKGKAKRENFELFVEDFLRSGVMLKWYQNQPNCEKTELQALERLTALSQKKPYGLKIAWHWLNQFGLPEGKTASYQNCENINQLIDYLLREKNTIYELTEERVPIVKDCQFLGILCMWGYDEAVEQIHNSWGKKPYEHFDFLFEFLEKYANRKHKERVRQYYHDYGSVSYLYWLQQNLNLYTYRGTRCAELKNRIASVWLDGTAEIRQQRQQFANLEKLVAEFLSYNKTNIFMAQIGLSNPSASECIYSNDSNAMWGCYFLDLRVPIGYLSYLELQEGV